MSQEVSNEQAVEEQLQTFIETVNDLRRTRSSSQPTSASEADLEAMALPRRVPTEETTDGAGWLRRRYDERTPGTPGEMDDNETIQPSRRLRRRSCHPFQETNDVSSVNRSAASSPSHWGGGAVERLRRGRAGGGRGPSVRNSPRRIPTPRSSSSPRCCGSATRRSPRTGVEYGQGLRRGWVLLTPVGVRVHAPDSGHTGGRSSLYR